MTKYYLGVDTSNYTTSLALVDQNGQVLENIKKMLTVKTGARGLRQAEAHYQHTNHLPLLIAELAKKVSLKKHLSGIGVSTQPRRQKDSYMPVFLAGYAMAKVLSEVLSVPVIEVSHQENHLEAALYSAGLIWDDLPKHFTAVHYSGGTSEVLKVTKKKDGYHSEIFSHSLDLHAGQLVDRIGILMGLPFPAGKHLEALAKKGKCIDEKPLHLRFTGDNFNLSGYENICKTWFEKGYPPQDIALTLFDILARVLIHALTLQKDGDYHQVLLFSGGVMSNRYIQQRLIQADLKYRTLAFAEPAFSSDNAVGCALLARRALEKTHDTQSD